MQRGSGLATHLIGAAFIVFADSFREAYVRTGMNLVQSIVWCAIDLGRRGWKRVQGSVFSVHGSGSRSAVPGSGSSHSVIRFREREREHELRTGTRTKNWNQNSNQNQNRNTNVNHEP